MVIGGHSIGICSWSLGCHSIAHLVAAVKELGLDHLQLALSMVMTGDGMPRESEMAVLMASGLQLTAGMFGFDGEDYSSIAVIKQTGGFVPDGRWEQRRTWAQQSLAAAKMLGLKAVSTHIGFVPPSNQAGYPVMVQRIRQVADLFAAEGVTLLMETGQEKAEELLQFINDVAKKNVGVNFDPANMILYGAGNPIDAIGVLGRHIRHVHIKDAIASRLPGMEWGTEVAFGDGEVQAARFVGALKQTGYAGALVIEREAGASRMADVNKAIEILQKTANA